MSFTKVFLKYQYKIFFFASLLLGFIPLKWFKGDLLVTEEYFGVDFSSWGSLVNEAWVDIYGYGGLNTGVVFKLQGYIVGLFQNIGMNLLESQISWHLFLWALCSIFMYIFLYRFFAKKVPAYLLFISTLFYLYTPYFLGVSVLASPPRIAFVLLPLLGVLILKYYSTYDPRSYFYLFVISLIFFIGSPVFANPPAGVSLVFFVCLSIFFKNILLGVKLFRFTLDLSFFLFTFFLLHFWWVLPITLSLVYQTDVYVNVVTSFNTISSSKGYEVLAQFGLWAFRDKVGEHFYYPYNVWYYKFPLVIIKYLPSLLVLYGIYSISKAKGVFNSEQKRLLKFFSTAFIIFLFLSKGTSGFGGSLYKLLNEKLFLFWVFREPYAKFMPVAVFLSPIFLIVGLRQLVEIVLQKFSWVSRRGFHTVILISLILVNFSIMWPFFVTDMHFDTNDGWIRSQRITPPDYWYELLSDWSPREGLYLLYPTYGLADFHEWLSGYSGNPYGVWTGVKTLGIGASVDANFSIDYNLYYIYKTLLEDPGKFVKIASRYNISGLIFQGDLFGDTQRARDAIRKNYSEYLSNVYGEIEIYTFSLNPVFVERQSFDNVREVDPLYHDFYINLKEFIPDNYFISYKTNAEKSLEISLKPFRLLDYWRDDLGEEVKGPLLFDSVNRINTLKISNFKIYNKYVLEYSGNFINAQPLIISIFQKNSRGENKRQVFEKIIVPKEGYNKEEFEIESSHVLEISPSDEYFLHLYPFFTDYGIFSQKNVIENFKINMNQKIISNLNKRSADNVRDYEMYSVNTTRLSKSYYAVEVLDKGDYLLQFKQAYSRHWRLLPINDDVYYRIMDKGVNITSLLKLLFGRKEKLMEPMNIEYYSNGWLINNLSNDHFLIVYWPSIISEVFFKIAILILGVALLLYIIVYTINSSLRFKFYSVLKKSLMR